MSGDAGYAALVGATWGSRDPEDRPGLKHHLEAATEATERALSEAELVSPLTLDARGRLQVLLRDPAAAMAAAGAASDAAAPTLLRFGLGWGPLETDVDPQSASRLDGPCVDRAREALEEARDEDGWARARGFDPARDATFGPLADAVGALRFRWTDRQAEIVRALRRHGGVQKRVAEEMDVARSTVSESLATARYREVRRAEEALGRLLPTRLRADVRADEP